MKHRMKIILVLMIIASAGNGGLWDDLRNFRPEELKRDSLLVQIADTLQKRGEHEGLRILDQRELGPGVIDIHQTKKYRYIPVDQYVISRPRLDSLILGCMSDSVSYPEGELRIQKLSLWYDGKPWLEKGYKLNAYSVFQGESGISRDWLWEIYLKREKKEEQAHYFGRLLMEFSQEQAKALEMPTGRDLYPFNYRRQLETWSDLLIFPGAWGLNVHFTLDYPSGDTERWVRGSPGIFYRKSENVESITMGGRHQSWNRRLSRNNDLVYKNEVALRIGVNNFERSYYEHLDWWEVLSMQLTWENSLHWRPAFYKGLYGGVGVFQIFRALPTVLPLWEPGLMLTVGLVLP